MKKPSLLLSLLLTLIFSTSNAFNNSKKYEIKGRKLAPKDAAALVGEDESIDAAGVSSGDDEPHRSYPPPSKYAAGDDASRKGPDEQQQEHKSKSSSGVPSRDYPPAETFAMSASSGKKAGSSKNSVGCNGSRLAASGKAGKADSSRRRRNNRRLKGGKSNGGSRGVEEDCVEEASGDASKKGLKGKEGLANKREYPTQVEDEDEAEDEAEDIMEETKVVVDEEAQSDQEAVECGQIASGDAPTTGYAITAMTISLDLQLNTSSYPLDEAYDDIQTYLQRDVAPSVAGCSDEDDVATGSIVNVLFGSPSEATEPCMLSPNEQLEGLSCHRTIMSATIYHEGELTTQEYAGVSRSLKSAIDDLNVEGLEGTNGYILASSETTETVTRASKSSEEQSRKVGFSMGMVGILLVALATSKFILGRKPREDKMVVVDDDDDTFVYPCEDDLLGSEFGDLQLENDRASHVSAARSTGSYDMRSIATSDLGLGNRCC